ncbi:hypothetical protein KW797_00175 [Candidatus Parcubacteria bacterium]|nr:hypothetical protein [Candidatus Parcubacteria bacterium]
MDPTLHSSVVFLQDIERFAKNLRENLENNGPTERLANKNLLAGIQSRVLVIQTALKQANKL